MHCGVSYTLFHLFLWKYICTCKLSVANISSVKPTEYSLRARGLISMYRPCTNVPECLGVAPMHYNYSLVSHPHMLHPYVSVTIAVICTVHVRSCNFNSREYSSTKVCT